MGSEWTQPSSTQPGIHKTSPSLSRRGHFTFCGLSLLPCKWKGGDRLAVLCPGGGKRGEPELGVREGKTPLKKAQHIPPRLGEGPQLEVVNGWTVTEPQEAAPDREGTGRLHPSLPPPRVQACPPEQEQEHEFQDLTPCWFKAGEGLTHFSITLTPGLAPGLAQRGSSGRGPRTSLPRPPPLCPEGWGHRAKGHLVPVLQGYEKAEHSC